MLLHDTRIYLITLITHPHQKKFRKISKYLIIPSLLRLRNRRNRVSTTNACLPTEIYIRFPVSVTRARSPNRREPTNQETGCLREMPVSPPKSKKPGFCHKGAIAPKPKKPLEIILFGVSHLILVGRTYAKTLYIADWCVTRALSHPTNSVVA